MLDLLDISRWDTSPDEQRERLRRDGVSPGQVQLPSSLDAAVRQGDFTRIDALVAALCQPGAPLFELLAAQVPLSRIEFILSLRDADDPDQEDGIWHDDGSRLLACTLSLTLDAARLEGGRLGIRQKATGQGVLIPTPPWGRLLLYQTGHQGYEHCIHQVTKGKRLVAALWAWP